MFFGQDGLRFEILDVFPIHQGECRLYHTGRPYHALSYRFRADATIEDGTRSFPMQEGSVTLMPAGVCYTRVAKYDELVAVHFLLPDAKVSEVESYVTENPHLFSRLFREIFTVFQEKKPGYRYRCNAIMNEILSLIAAESSEEREESLIFPSVRYMREHFRSPDLSMEEIARESHVSEVYFRRVFKREYGVPPFVYLSRLRLENAKALLSAGYYSYKEVASLSGYRDYSYFSAEFHRATGVPPSRYLNDKKENGL